MAKNVSDTTQSKIDEVVAALNTAAAQMTEIEKYFDEINIYEFEAALDILGEHKQSFLDVYDKRHIFPNIYTWDLNECWNENEDSF